MIEVQRFYRPLGFTVRFGVARYRLPFADLVPGTNQAIPGYRFDVPDIAPNHIGRWTYSSPAGLNLQLEDLAALEHRVRPCERREHSIRKRGGR